MGSTTTATVCAGDRIRSGRGRIPRVRNDCDDSDTDLNPDALGPEDVAEALHNVALLYHSQGRYVEAEAFYQRSFAMAENVLSDHLPTWLFASSTWRSSIKARGSTARLSRSFGALSRSE